MLTTITVVARIILGSTFIYAGVRKLGQHREFANAVESFGLAPTSTTPLLAWIIPLLECAGGCGLLFFSGAVIQYATLELGGLLLLFSLALTISWWRRQVVVCNCFGAGENDKAKPTAYFPALARNFSLLTGSIFIEFASPNAWRFLPSSLIASHTYQAATCLALTVMVMWIMVQRRRYIRTLLKPATGASVEHSEMPFASYYGRGVESRKLDRQ